MTRLCLALALFLSATSALADPAAPLRTAIAAVPQVADSTGLGPAFADTAAAAGVLAGIDLAAHDPSFAGPLGPLALAAPLGGSPALSMTAGAAWPRLVGFGPDNILAVVNYGEPPAAAVRITLAPGVSAAVPAALTGSGYVEAATAFGPLFRRGEPDYAVSFTTRNPDDPFGGMLGQASRVLLQGDVLTRAAGMPPLEAGMTGPFWGDRGDLAAILDALSALPPDTVILRAQILTDQAAFAGGGITAGAADGKTPVLADSGPGMSPWSLGLIADVVQAGAPGVVFAFAYATDLEARTAAQAVDAGWQVASPVAGAPPADFIGPATTAVAGDGPFVLTVNVSGAWSAGPMLRNQPFDRAYAALMQRDLAVFGPPM